VLLRLVAFEHSCVTRNRALTRNRAPDNDTLVIWSAIDRTLATLGYCYVPTRVLVWLAESACQSTRIRNPALLATNPPIAAGCTRKGSTRCARGDDGQVDLQV